MTRQPKTVLVVAPHPDDESLGCGGYIARLIEEGSIVHVLTLSDCRESLPGMPSDTLRKEAAAASICLGSTLTWEDYPVRRFPQYRQEILERLVELRHEINPDLVLCPSPTDRHQDHFTIAYECLRAFRCSVWGYHLMCNEQHPNFDIFVSLEERHLQRKIDALRCYESQTTLQRPYMDPELTRSTARVWGAQCGARYSESFTCMRLVI